MHPSPPPARRRFSFDPPIWVLLLTAALFFAALMLRLQGLTWDAWANLHPDERHMIFVAQDMQSALAAALEAEQPLWQIWFGPQMVLDPRAEGRLYVYGDLPLLALVWLSHLTGQSDWGSMLWLGRNLTALIDSSVILAVVIASRLLGLPARAGLAAAVLLALAPTGLQLSVFFTVDAWLAAFSAWALVAMLSLLRFGGLGRSLLLGGLVACAAACKITAGVLLLPALVVFAALWRKSGGGAALRLLLAGLLAGLLTFRLANPSAFVGAGFGDLRLSPEMIADFRELIAFGQSPDMPPNWQWQLGYSALALARDMLLFGTGPLLGLLGLAGAISALRRPNALYLTLLAAALACVLGNATGEVRALRYLAPLLASFALFALLPLSRLSPPALLLTACGALWWASGILRLQDGGHPRVLASQWIMSLPPEAVIAHESDWDDKLPLMHTLPAAAWVLAPPRRALNLQLTDAESAQTAARLAQTLSQSDYLVMTSGRQVEVLPRLKARFPTAARYYHALLQGELCFGEVFHIDRGYPLWGWRIDDQFTQEPWRVYDHPIVRIWQKQPCFDKGKVQALLSAG